MPKSFGNKTFTAPPTATKLQGAAGDLAELQQAMQQMTIMNRMFPNARQSTRRVVLGNGAVVTVRNAFGHETVSIDRRSVVSSEVSCRPYVESGRLRWDSGTIDISGDITGCNGPCPGTPIAPGPSAALAKFGRAECCEKAPPSGFTGKTQLMVQAIYGTKRTDVRYASGGEVTIAGVLFGHSWVQSAILYTDTANQYWLLQLNGMFGAAIQRWSPCSEVFDAMTVDREAYRLSLCAPVGPIASVPCTGVAEENDSSAPFAYGWHATNQGNSGHVVLHRYVIAEGVPYNYYALESRLCSFTLNDAGVAQEPGQSFADYVALRFSIDFSVLDTSEPYQLRLSHKIWVPIHDGDYDSFTGKTFWMLRTGVFIPEYISRNSVENAPIYCFYDKNDVLKVVRYTFTHGTIITDLDLSGGMDGSCPKWRSHRRQQYQPETTVGFLIDGSEVPFNVDEEHYQRLWEWTHMGPCDLPAPTNSIQNETLKTHTFHQLLVIPHGNHEGIVLHSLEERKARVICDKAVFPLVPVKAGGYGIQWNRKIRTISRQHDEEVESISGAEGIENIDPTYGDFVGDILDPQPDSFPYGLVEGIVAPKYYSGSTEVGEEYKAWTGDMELYYAKTNYVAYERLSSQESYQHGHRNALFTADQSVVAYDGYNEFVNDGCFVGKS